VIEATLVAAGIGVAVFAICRVVDFFWSDGG
jgi:hypothetical protein